jgi:hypothetical protein
MSQNYNYLKEDLNYWNWGAFLLTPFWSLSHQIWIGLFCWLPHFFIHLSIGILISGKYDSWGVTLLKFLVILRPIFIIMYLGIAITLGFQGTSKALKKSESMDIRIFKAIQTRWTLAGILIGIPYTAVLFYILFMSIDVLYFIVNH